MKGLFIKDSSSASENKSYLLTLCLLVMVGIQVFTCIRLTQARHEIRTLKGEFEQVASLRQTLAEVSEDVTAHDEMLETVGDDVTLLEQQLNALASRKTRKVAQR